MASLASGVREVRLTKTAAMSKYALAATCLDGIDFKSKKNRRGGAPIRLYLEADVQAAAVTRHGTVAEALKEADARAAKRTVNASKRALAQKESGVADAKRALRDIDSSSAAASSASSGVRGRLPVFLAERTRVVNDVADLTASGGPGARVVYIMQTALRVDENPALLTARCLASQLGTRLMVLATLVTSEAPSWWSTERRLVFALEGVRDVAVALSATRDVDFHLYLDHGEGLTPVLAIVQGASVVVTEDMPLPPHSYWTQTVGAAVNVPVLAVDSHCIVPQHSAEARRSFSRAYSFRSACADIRNKAIHQGALSSLFLGLAQGLDEKASGASPASAALIPSSAGPELSFRDMAPFLVETGPEHGTVDDMAVRTAVLHALEGVVCVDRSVPAVTQLRGGSRWAEGRWRHYCQSGGLRDYGSVRNQPTRVNGVSRLSAYSHWGMISPFRVASEAKVT